MPLYNLPSAVSSYQDPREHQGDQVRDFLTKIGMIESSGGTNTDHPELHNGLHAGTSAVGDYGLMPKTAQDLDKQYNINQLQDLTPQDAQAKLESDPGLQDRIAASFASKLLSKMTPEEAAYKWQFGQNSSPTPEDIANSPRVKKFKVLGKNAT